MDNERPIEKLLRAFAKKRRADAGSPLEMHPATRRMLQGEVARQFPRTESSGTSPTPFLTSLLPRLAWALPILTVLAVGIWAIVYSPNQRGTSVDLAKNTTAPRSASEQPGANDSRGQPTDEVDRLSLTDADKSPAKANERASGLKQEELKSQPLPMPAGNAARQLRSAGAPTSPEMVSRENPPKETSSVNRNEQPAAFAGGATVPGRAAPAATRADTASARTDPDYKGRKLGGNVPTSSSVATAPASVPAPAVAMKRAEADSRQQDAGAKSPIVTQSFVQTQAVRSRGAEAKQGLEPAQVLRKFQLEQAGSQLRVIDSDGSSYTGLVESVVAVAGDARPTAATGQVGKSKADLGLAAQQTVRGDNWNYQAGQNYSFRVTGTNRTRQQLVVFEGNLVTPNSIAISTQVFYSAQPAAGGQLAPAQASSPLLLNSTISGKVRLGADQEMQIKAVPVTP